MRHVGNFNPEWGYLAPAPSLLRTVRVFLVAVAVGATASAAVVFSLMDGPAAEMSVAARTLVPSAQPSPPAPPTRDTQLAAARSERVLLSLTPGAEASSAMAAQGAGVAAHTNAGSPVPGLSAPATTPRAPAAGAALAEAPKMMTTDAPPAPAFAPEGNTALAIDVVAPPAAAAPAHVAAPAAAVAPALRAPVKKPRAVARAAVPPRYDVPRYAAPRYEPRYAAMQRGPYAFLRQYGSFGQY